MSSLTAEERKEICESHYGLVDIVVDELLSRKYNTVYRQYRDELHGIATVAFVKASYKFDPSRGFLFRTYASHYMRAILVTEFRAITKRWKDYCSLEATEDTHYEPYTTPVDDIEDEEEEESLVDFLEPEDPLERRIYYEYVLNRHNIEETAKDIGIPYGTLRVKGARLIKKLKEKLKDSEYKNLIKEN